jgi:hypothetical protein
MDISTAQSLKLLSVTGKSPDSSPLEEINARPAARGMSRAKLRMALTTKYVA